jgi:hypothetical protein
MKASRFSEAQKAFILKHGADGKPVADVYRKAGICQATYSTGRRGMTAPCEHGLTAETVIGALEDAADYESFEAAITADYDAQSTVERKLVLRLASLLWRLRRAATIETGLFEIQADQVREHTNDRQIAPSSRQIVYELFEHCRPVSHGRTPHLETIHETGPSARQPPIGLSTSRVAFTVGQSAQLCVRSPQSL